MGSTLARAAGGEVTGQLHQPQSEGPIVSRRKTLANPVQTVTA